MQHKTNQHKGFNKQQKTCMLGFILGAFILSPLVKDAASALLGMRNYPVFAFVLGCVGLFMLPLLVNTFSPSQH